MHPIITYFKSDIGLIRNASVIISGDNQHDFNAVRHFQELVDQEITEKNLEAVDQGER